MKKKTIIIIALIYVLSCFGCYKTIQWTFNNRFIHSEPDWFHVLLCFLPGGNTATCIIWPIANYLDDVSAVNFFNTPKRK